ncbi:MAG: helix-turn-helix domain-containing protein [Clostridiales bacterium]|nr:helix-turn-helix domain-containing protein [Clostridiales bacterium]
MKQKELCQLAKVISATIAKMKNGDNVMVGVLERICLSLHSNVGDIIEIGSDATSASSNLNHNAFPLELTQNLPDLFSFWISALPSDIFES